MTKYSKKNIIPVYPKKIPTIISNLLTMETIITKNWVPVFSWNTENAPIDFWKIIKWNENGYNLDLYIGYARVSKKFDLSAPLLSDFLKEEGYKMYYYNIVSQDFIEKELV